MIKKIEISHEMIEKEMMNFLSRGKQITQLEPQPYSQVEFYRIRSEKRAFYQADFESISEILELN